DVALPAPLRLVESPIGSPDELVRRRPARGKRRDAGRDRRNGLDPPLAEQHPGDPVGDTGGGVGPAVDDDRELVAADAEDLLVRANRPDESPRDRAQHPVARGMAFAVVDLLEVVEVDEDKRDLAALVLDARD